MTQHYELIKQKLKDLTNNKENPRDTNSIKEKIVCEIEDNPTISMILENCPGGSSSFRKIFLQQLSNEKLFIPSIKTYLRLLKHAIDSDRQKI